MDIANAVLRANDYAPLFRPNLAAISYNVLRLVDIRRMVQLSLVNLPFAVSAIGYDESVADALPGETNGGETASPREKFVFAWAREQFEDRGQTHDSAQALATLAVTQGQTSNTAKFRRVARAYERALRVGLIYATRAPEGDPPRQNLPDLLTAMRATITSSRLGRDFVSTEDGTIVDDVFTSADATAYLMDDAGTAAYLGEQDAIIAAEDQLQDSDTF
jgi:hypothetical protein